MDAILSTKFENIGARAKVRSFVANRWRQSAGPVMIDIGNDRHGEFFDIQSDGGAQVEVLDVQPKDRHLLLMVRQPSERAGLPDTKDKFLCGHDERHWFVVAVPEGAPVSNVTTAKQALKPKFVQSLERGRKGKQSRRHRRKNDVFIRQGEWFFLPDPNARISEKLVLLNEPISRGRGSKPHICQFLHRDGGVTVYVCGRYPNGLVEAEYKKVLKDTGEAKRWNWQAMQRDPVVFVRGKISHSDHATVHLDVWHRVEMNTENKSRAMAQVAFLD